MPVSVLIVDSQLKWVVESLNRSLLRYWHRVRTKCTHFARVCMFAKKNHYRRWRRAARPRFILCLNVVPSVLTENADRISQRLKRLGGGRQTRNVSARLRRTASL